MAQYTDTKAAELGEVVHETNQNEGETSKEKYEKTMALVDGVKNGGKD